MPVMDGPTALKEMKSDPGLVDIPVLFLTARTSGDDLAAGLELGAQDYLRKPCEPAELNARVAAALRQRIQAETLRHLALEADRLSTVDDLTGVANRRRFDLQTAEMLRATGGDTTVGLLVIDVDHFKRVNDVEGHPVGDAVLRIVAGRLSEAVGARTCSCAGVARSSWSWRPFRGRGGRAGRAAAPRDRRRPVRRRRGPGLDITVSVGCVTGRLDGLAPPWRRPTRRSTRRSGGRDRVEVHGA